MPNSNLLTISDFSDDQLTSNTLKNKGASLCHRITFLSKWFHKEPLTSEETFCFTKGSLWQKKVERDGSLNLWLNGSLWNQKWFFCGITVNNPLSTFILKSVFYKWSISIICIFTVHLAKQPSVYVLTGCQVWQTKPSKLLFKTSPFTLFHGFPLRRDPPPSKEREREIGLTCRLKTTHSNSVKGKPQTWQHCVLPRKASTWVDVIYHLAFFNNIQLASTENIQSTLLHDRIWFISDLFPHELDLKTNPCAFSNAISRPIHTYFTRWLIRTKSYDLTCTILYNLSKPQWR